MPRGVSARVVCIVALAAGSARAQPEKHRPVAVIDLSGDPAAKTLRSSIEDALYNHWALRPPSDKFDRVLEGNLLDEDRDALAVAHDAEVAAEDALAQFDVRGARDSAKKGLAVLTTATPTVGAALRADLAFSLGIAELSARDNKAAMAAFALAARLDPIRRPDPERYMDVFIRAFEAAKTAPAPKVALQVNGSGHVWIDGVLAGSAKATFEVAAGKHIVQLADSDRLTLGAIVDVPTTGPVVIADAPADVDLQIARARVALARAPDATARAGTLAQLAQLIGVRDAVLITKTDAGKLYAQTVTWKDGALAYSAPRDTANADPDALLEPLSGPKPIDEGPKEPPPPRVKPLVTPHVPENEPAWYRKRWVQASFVGGAIATAVTIFLVAHRAHYVTPPMKAEFPQ